MGEVEGHRITIGCLFSFLYLFLSSPVSGKMWEVETMATSIRLEAIARMNWNRWSTACEYKGESWQYWCPTKCLTGGQV